ncbi:MAG: hypothetical protein MUF63_08895, partial [Rhodobacteraceae bacterium]|nr:hypothetical protein [Paracoccaceae bacterium]
HDTRQFITNEGADVAEYGMPWVSRSPRVLYPEGFPTTFEGWPSTRWGIHQVWNLTKYVFHYNDAIPGEGGAFGDPIKILVENRDRTLGAIGHRDSKFSSLATVLNDDYAVVPEGLDATLWGSNLVADRIRSLYPEPLEATVVSIHNEVHNDARLLSPAGFGGEVLGTPHAENTRRYFDFWGWDSLSFGTAFAAPAIRTVAVGMGPESDFGIHDAQLATRYLSPPGINPLPQFGAHDFFERFNIIYPTGPRLTRYGDNGRVYNVTPEVAPFGADLSLWGTPAVRLQYRFILPDGHPATLFGRAAVADRRLYIRPVGPGVLGVGFEHEVRNLIADPPAEQKIKPTSFWGTLWGTAEVRRNEIHPDGLAATLWGSGQVRMMGCYPAGIPPLSGQVPSPWVRGPRYLPAEAIKAPDDPENGLGVTKHAIWPYTIYCTFDVTDQAIRNNGGEFWHLMDTQVFGPEHPERPVFGDALVALAQRSIAPSGADVSRMDGVPGVENRRRYLQVTGTKMTRFGIPTIPFPRTLKPLPIAPPVELYSFSKVENQHRYVAPPAISIYLPVSEGARVEHFNRTISVGGFDAFSSAGHRVHPPEPLIPVGFDATKWGATWASNRVRTVEPQGFDSFDSSHTPGRFAERMRVTRRGSSVAPKGWHHMRVGSPSIGRPQPERQDIFIEA